eukprot:1128648-Lingulodinium_polyedra.AAC.1
MLGDPGRDPVHGPRVVEAGAPVVQRTPRRAKVHGHALLDSPVDGLQVDAVPVAFLRVEQFLDGVL